MFNKVPMQQPSDESKSVNKSVKRFTFPNGNIKFSELRSFFKDNGLCVDGDFGKRDFMLASTVLTFLENDDLTGLMIEIVNRSRREYRIDGVTEETLTLAGLFGFGVLYVMELIKSGHEFENPEDAIIYALKQNREDIEYNI